MKRCRCGKVPLRDVLAAKLIIARNGRGKRNETRWYRCDWGRIHTTSKS